MRMFQILFLVLLACGGAEVKRETPAAEKPTPRVLDKTGFCFLLYDMKAEKFVREMGGKNR